MDLTNIPRLPPLKQSNPLSNPTPMSDEEDDDEDSMAGEDDTAAMDLTDVIPSNAAAMSPFKPVEEGNDSMDITTALGQIRPVTTPMKSPSRSFFAESPSDQAMDMTKLVGGILQAAHTSILEEDETANMDETRIYESTVHTVATVEDDTQRYVEGSVTQADGLTQNMDLTKALPAQIRMASPARVGFSWGTANIQTQVVQEQSLVDISMADVTVNEDEEVAMDMTTVLGADETVDMEETRLYNRDSLGADSQAETEADMSFTRVLTPAKRSPNKTVRRLSSGAIRSPVPAAILSPTKTPKVSTPRRKSLLDHSIPVFGTPETQIRVEAGSVQRPEFGSGLVKGTDIRVSMLKDKIQSLTPRKPASIESPKASPLKRKFTTPQKTPQRSLIAPSVSRPVTPAARGSSATLDPIELNEFLKMTGISFLTGLSTTRRRETFVMPAQTDAEDVDPFVAKVLEENFTMPMLEMYQHSCRELTRYITEGRAMCEEIESDMNEQNPEIFDTYRRASPAEKRDLETTFKDMKTTARLSAKGVWYVWRENLLSNVLVPLRNNVSVLEKEKLRLDALEADVLPRLARAQADYEDVKAKVEVMLKEEDAYESYDHDGAAQLLRLAAEIDEELQATESKQLAIQQSEADLDARITQLEAEIAHEESSLEVLEREAANNRGFSADEITELDARYAQLTQQTGYAITRVTDCEITMTLLDSLHVSFPFDGSRFSYEVLVDNDSIKQYYLTRLMLDCTSIRETLTALRRHWTFVLAQCQRITQVTKLHPTTISINSDDNLAVTSTVLLPTRVKFHVTWTWTPIEETPMVEVSVVYGGLDPLKLADHIRSKSMVEAIKL